MAPAPKVYLMEAQHPADILATLLDALLSMLWLDFAYAETTDGQGPPTTLLRMAERGDERRAKFSVIALRVGLHDEAGVLIAGSRRPEFPTTIEMLLLRVAMNEAAIALFLGSAQRWTTSCLILDLRMGGMDGLTLQQRLVTDGSHFPVIILTAHGDPKAREQALRLGAFAFLPKPFDGDVLLAVVGSVFGEV